MAPCHRHSDVRHEPVQRAHGAQGAQGVQREQGMQGAQGVQGVPGVYDLGCTGCRECKGVHRVGQRTHKRRGGKATDGPKGWRRGHTDPQGTPAW